MPSATPLQTLPTRADSPATGMRMSAQAPRSKQPFQHSFLNWSTIAPRCSVSSMLGGAATGQGCCLALLLSSLPSYSRSLSQQSHLRDVPGYVNIWSGWAQAQPEWTFGLGSQIYPFLPSSGYGSSELFVEKLTSANLQAKIQMVPLPEVVKACSCFLYSTRDWTIVIWVKI